MPIVAPGGKKWEEMGHRPMIMLFRGANPVTLDAKGRLAMPARYRERIRERSQGRLVVTVDRDKCLLLYPTPDWEEIERKLMELPSLNPQARRLQRLMVGHATDLELDGHGRLLLPLKHREFAGLRRDAVLIGQGNRFELWEEERWKAREEEWLEGEGPESDLPPELEKLSL